MKWSCATRTTDILGAVALLAIAGISYALGVHPARVRAAQAAEAGAALAARSEELTAVVGESAAARDALERDRARLDAAFPLRDLSRQNERLRELSLAAEAQGLKLDELRPGGITWDRRFGAVPIRLSGTAGYQPFVGFIRRLAVEFPDVRVVSFSLGAQAGTASSTPSFSTELIWFTLPQQANPPAPAASAATAGAASTAGKNP